MEFWKTYFTVVEVLKHRISTYEELLAHLADRLEKMESAPRASSSALENEREDGSDDSAESSDGAQAVHTHADGSSQAESNARELLKSSKGSLRGMTPKINFSSKSILLIEPLEKNRILITRYLTALGIKVEFARTEDEARLKKNETQFDLMIDTSGMTFPIEKITLIERVKESLEN